MVQELGPIANTVTITSSTHPRAASAEVIATQFERHGIDAMVWSSLTEALSYVLGNSHKKDIVLITGSLFVVAEAIEFFQHDSTY
jgi:folylpolyglutamate synthase/dihydropteroate synthase